MRPEHQFIDPEECTGNELYISEVFRLSERNRALTESLRIIADWPTVDSLEVDAIKQLASAAIKPLRRPE